MGRPGSNSSVLPRLMIAAGAAMLLAKARRQSRRIDLRGKSVVITGGSRGLGLTLARLFAAEGARLTLLARGAEGLECARRDLSDHGADVLVHVCDVRRREAVERAVRFVLDARGRIDVLINNAGVIQVGPVENMDLADYEEALEVHVWGPLHLLRAVLPPMREQGGGRIVNITSIGGLVAVPHLLPYTMSKFALTGLSDGIRAELAKDGILVTTVAPGLMRTGSHVNAMFKGDQEKEFAWFSLSAAIPLVSMSAERAARQIVESCRYGDPRLIIGVPARLLHGVNALFPGVAAAGQKLAGRLLPAADGGDGHRRKTGWLSRSARVPEPFLRPVDREIEPHLQR